MTHYCYRFMDENAGQEQAMKPLKLKYPVKDDTLVSAVSSLSPIPLVPLQGS